MSPVFGGVVEQCCLGVQPRPTHAASSGSTFGSGARRASQPTASTSACTSGYPINSKSRVARERRSRTAGQSCSFTPTRRVTTSSYSFPARAPRGTATCRIAPLQPQSQTGENLAYVLRSEPERFEEAVDAEVKRIRREVTAPVVGLETGDKDQNDLLTERMRTVKELELRRHLGDVLYTCVVKSLGDYEVSLTPSVYKYQLNKLSSNAHIEVPLLLEIPTDEARSVVIEHVRKVCRSLPKTVGHHTPILLPKRGAAQVYKNSAIFGYCLRRVTERFELEKLLLQDQPILEEVLKSLDLPFTPFGTHITGEILRTKNSWRDGQPASTAPTYAASHQDELHGGHPEMCGEAAGQWRRSTLPACSLKEYASLYLEHGRVEAYLSGTAHDLVHRHTDALFGSVSVLSSQVERAIEEAQSEEEAQQLLEEAMRSGQVESLELSLMGVRRLVLEAVAVGSLLWDAERSVDMQCPLTQE